MRRKNKESVKTISAAFLDILGIGTILTVAQVLSAGRFGPKFLKIFSRYALHRIREMLRRLKIQGLIQYDERDENSPILLTKKGFIRLTKNSFHEKNRNKWDHFWRIIVFDIPERKGVRRNFQRTLDKIGCYRIQRSVYAYPYDCIDAIRCLASSKRISKYVSVIVTPDLGQHENIARQFYFQKAAR